MGALTDYTTATQQLLHDSSFRFWTQTQLTLYINQARNKVAQDTFCLRQLVTNVNLTQGVEQYAISSLYSNGSFPAGAAICSVMGISINWGGNRIKLRDWSWTRLDAMTRGFQNLQQVPFAFARLGSSTIFVGPMPNQTYVSDWEVSITPTPLVSDSTTETIPQPFTSPIPFYAARQAKLYEQNLGESEYFMKLYKAERNEVATANLKRQIANAYDLDGN